MNFLVPCSNFGHVLYKIPNVWVDNVLHSTVHLMSLSCAGPVAGR